MPRPGNRQAFIERTPKGQEAFSKLSKADFADIAAAYAVRFAGEELTADQLAGKFMAEIKLQQEYRELERRK